MNITKIGRQIARIVNEVNKKIISIATPEENNELELKIFNQMEIKSGKLQYLPNNESRDVIAVLGSSGSGKSYWIKSYCEEYHRKFPKYEIFLFSESDEDPLFDKVKYIKRIQINDELLDDPIIWDEFKDCLVIFDDIDALKGDYKKYIYALRDKLLKNSRKFNVSVIVSNHNMTDGHDTKSLLNESNIIVFFMNNNFNRSIQYLLTSYIGLSKEGIDKLKNIETRPTVYIKSYPQIIMTDKFISTINELSKK